MIMLWFFGYQKSQQTLCSMGLKMFVRKYFFLEGQPEGDHQSQIMAGLVERLLGDIFFSAQCPR